MSPNRNSRKSSTKRSGPSRKSPASRLAANEDIIACGKRAAIGTQVILWNQHGGLACPNKRGRPDCHEHDPALNDAPTRPHADYQIRHPESGLHELQKVVHQFVLHYDVCYTSHHCHQVMRESPFKGSHFYLDLDGTIYQTCDLYWKTNTAPADDRRGNERSIHVEIANLSWQALAEESDLYKLSKDAYRKTRDRWRLHLPNHWKEKIKTQNFTPRPARVHGERGYFSRTVNGRVVRMWDFTEEQYQALIRLCIGVHQLLPRIELKVPYDPETRRTPLDRLPDFSKYCGILGHAHVQGGTDKGVTRKYDPGSAFNWSRLRQALSDEASLDSVEPLT